MNDECPKWLVFLVGALVLIVILSVLRIASCTVGVGFEEGRQMVREVKR